MLSSVLQEPGPRQAPGGKKGERDRVKIRNQLDQNGCGGTHMSSELTVLGVLKREE